MYTNVIKEVNDFVDYFYEKYNLQPSKTIIADNLNYSERTLRYLTNELKLIHQHTSKFAYKSKRKNWIEKNYKKQTIQHII